MRGKLFFKAEILNFVFLGKIPWDTVLWNYVEHVEIQLHTYLHSVCLKDSLKVLLG